jgi:hypothetical protein
MVTNLLDAPYRGYALYVGRTVGDQPGRSTAGYESEWKRLPNGVIFQLDQYDFAVAPDRAFLTNTFRFPTVLGADNVLPFIAFDGQGSLVDATGRKLPEDEFIDLARGSIFEELDQNGNWIGNDVREVTQGPIKERLARIQIDAFSGRARVLSNRDL